MKQVKHLRRSKKGKVFRAGRGFPKRRSYGNIFSTKKKTFETNVDLEEARAYRLAQEKDREYQQVLDEQERENAKLAILAEDDEFVKLQNERRKKAGLPPVRYFPLKP